MNDDRFIEQLNAYIDRELSGDDIREVEAEIATNPARQRIFQSYCKIDKACQTLLSAEEVRAPKPSIAAILAASGAQSDGDVIEFKQASAAAKAHRRNSGLNWGTAFAGLAAACVAAFVYIAGPEDPASLASPDAAMPSVAAVGMGPDDSVENRSQSAYRTVFAIDSNSGASGDSFAWMSQLQFAPIQPVQVDSLVFKTAEPLKVRTLSAYSYPYPGLDDTPPLSETAAFQFQR